MRLFVAVVVLALALAGQQPPVKFTTTLVVVDVTVEDRSGKPVQDLKKEDFAVLEDGKPQAIAILDFEQLSSEVLPSAPPPLKRSLFVAPEKPEGEPVIRQA